MHSHPPFAGGTGLLNFGLGVTFSCKMNSFAAGLLNGAIIIREINLIDD